MRRFLLSIAAMSVSVVLLAQAQLTTKKAKLEDFPEKTMKVVLTGNYFFDSELQGAIRNGWTLSPYEFCSLDEFESLKCSSDWYFLITVNSMFKKETVPGIDMLSLVKGGESAAEGIHKMLDVVTIPLCSTEDPSGREIVFLPALIDIIQQQASNSIEKDLAKLAFSNLNLSRKGDLDIVFSEDDVMPSAMEEFGETVNFLSEDEVDAIMIDGEQNAIVSYVVAPSDPQKGSYCYKMLIHASTHKLYYFRKQKISAKKPAAFMASEIKKICAK